MTDVDWRTLPTYRVGVQRPTHDRSDDHKRMIIVNQLIDPKHNRYRFLMAPADWAEGHNWDARP